MRRIIIDAGGGSGEWSRSYRLAGYDVRVIDPIAWPFLRAADYLCNEPVHGLLMAPPCTEFAVSGSRWWASKPAELLEQAIATVREFLALKDRLNPSWWALENPVGRLARCVPELGRHRYTWHPWQYGTPEVKLTCMWGEHIEPIRCPVPGPYNARVHLMAPSPDRARMRSITPAGFARAFFEANP